MSEEEKVVVAQDEAQPAAPTMESVMHDPDAPVITMKKLLEAGSHFGHQTRRWNPKMKKYIYDSRNGVYIIDLAKTVTCIDVAYAELKKIVEANGEVMFVGTKKQCHDIIEAEAQRSGSFYVNSRWLGGTLTNYRTIRRRIEYFKKLLERQQKGEFDMLPKKEAVALLKEIDKLTKNFNGIKEIRRLPKALIVVDPRIEHNAVAEAHKLGIPVFGIIDTNSDPDMIDFPIPANDDAARSVSLILAVLADAIVESKGGLTVVAHVKDDEKEITMTDVIAQTDEENRKKLEIIRAERRARNEAQKAREAEKAAREGGDGVKKPYNRKPMNKKPMGEKKVVTEAPKEETKVEENK